jgi:peptide/nickel transport system permease protein
MTFASEKSTTGAGFASRRTLVLRRFLRNRPAVVAFVVLCLLFIGCYAVPPLLPYRYTDMDFGALLQPPGARHWLGTNALGQDLLAQTLRGMQKSMIIGVCVAFISTVIAATVGTISGYFAGWRDRVLMWIVDLMLVVPSFLLISIVVQRTKGDILWLIVMLAAFSWMISSRIVRGLTMSLRDREFIAAARYMGVSNRRIIVRHILPNVASTFMVIATLELARAIVLEATLSFLGLGIQPPTPSWGGMIHEGREYLDSAWWISVCPGVVLMLTSLVVSRTGDWLRDVLDPTLRGES